MIKKFILVLLITAVFTINAEDNLKKDPDSSKKVSETKTRVSIRNVPANTVIITKEDLEGHTIQEALSIYSGVNIYNLLTPYTNSVPGIRGTGGALVMIDGVKINNSDGNPVDWFSIPEGAVERIEVLKGGSSSLFGDNAAALVIDIITKVPEKEISVNADGRFGDNKTLDGFVSASMMYGPGYLALSAERQEGDGWQDNTDYENTGFTGKAGLKVSDKLDIKLSVLGSVSEYELSLGLSEIAFEDDPKQSVNSGDYTDRKLLLLDITSLYEVTDLTDISFNASFLRSNVNINLISIPYIDDYETYLYCINPYAVLDLPGLLWGSSFKIGIDYSFENTDFLEYDDAEKTSKTLDVAVNRNTIGLNTAAESFIREDLVFLVTARTELSRISAEFEDSSVNGSTHQIPVVYGAGLTYFPDDLSKAYLSYNRIFRYPSFPEQFEGSVAFFDSLDLETGNSFEAGFEYNSLEKLKCGINLFLMNMDKIIMYNSSTSENENSAGSIHYGAETYMKIIPYKVFSTKFNYNYTVAEYTRGEYDKNTVPLTPLHVFSIIPELLLMDIINIKAEFTYTDRMYQSGDYENIYDRNDRYLLVNYSASFRQSFSGADMKVYFNIDNFFNDDTPTRADTVYFSRPGREIKIGASVSY